MANATYKNAPQTGGALDGITVLELGMVMQVPFAGQMLGDLGANVIKVERPQGDILRGLDFEANRTGGMSSYYAAMGRNKKALSLDLKNPFAFEILLSLVDRADVLLHNFRPGVMERLGLGFADLNARNPRLIYAAGFGFGETGPLAGMPGQDMLAQAFSGLARGGLDEDEPPRIMNSPIIDYGAGMSLVQAVLAALVERQRSGLGQMVSTSLFDVAIAMQLNEIASESIYGIKTNWLRQAMVVKTLDGWVIVVMLFRDNPLQLLCNAMELPDISGRPDYDTRDKQIQRLATIQDYCEAAFASRTSADVIGRLAKVDLLCAPVNELAEAVSHPQAAENGIMWDVEVPGRGSVALAGLPVRMSRTPPTLRLQPAPIGAATEDVLAEFGFSEEKIREARSNKAFG